MDHTPVLLLVLQAITAVVSLAAVGISTVTFLRYDRWRREDKTEITIKQMDQQARNDIGVLAGRFEARAKAVDEALGAITRKTEAETDAIHARINSSEGELRNSIQQVDSRIRRDLTKQGEVLAALHERAQHLPTQADMHRLTETMATVGGQVAANGARTDGLNALVLRIDASVQRIEEHNLR